MQRNPERPSDGEQTPRDLETIELEPNPPALDRTLTTRYDAQPFLDKSADCSGMLPSVEEEGQ